MSFTQISIRILANLLFFLKQKEIENSGAKIIVFTGTSGKTTMKDTVYTVLHGLDIPVLQSKYGYSNELGIILTIMDIQNFSIKNPKDWLRLLQKKVSKGTFICVELGADFYKDTEWFLKKFSPYGVCISASDDTLWSRALSEVRKERRRLLASVPLDGFVAYNADDTEIKKLIEESFCKAKLLSFSLRDDVGAFIFLKHWKNPFASLPINEAIKINDALNISVGGSSYGVETLHPLFEPQIYGLLATYACVHYISPRHLHSVSSLVEEYKFSENRLQIYVARNGAVIIEDSYKATPLCMLWYLEMSAKILAKRKILVMTEMRPLLFNREHHYAAVADASLCMDSVYYIGPHFMYGLLVQGNQRVKEFSKGTYDVISKELLECTGEGDLILLKGSFRYHLEDIRKRLTEESIDGV